MKTRKTNRLLALLLSLCILLSVLPLSSTLSAFAQEGDIPITAEHFPDENFRNWLMDPTNIGGVGKDSVLTPEEITSIERMDVVGVGADNDPTNITDVTGIQLFRNLRYLNCYYHPGLTKLDLSGLKFLVDVNCSWNSLTELKVSGCESLITLHANNNQLKELDLTGVPITTLTGGSQSLTLELLGSEATGFTLPIALKNPVLSGANANTVFYENGILISRDKSANWVDFEVETGANNRLLRGRFQLTYQEDIPVNEVIFPDENFRNWLLDETNLGGAGEDGVLTPEELAAVTAMDVSGLGIADLTGIQCFTSLKTLDCSGNNLLALDVSGLTQLISFSGDGQTASRVLTNKGTGDYTLPIALKNPVFTGTNAVSYENGSLISRDRTVTAVEFTTNIGLPDKKLSGGLHLTYLDDYDGIAIQQSTFPDPAFRAWLKNEENLGGVGKDGLLTTEEIATVTSISLQDPEITDLTGIRFFTALSELSCTGMAKLNSLDVSGLTKLKTLTCSNTGVKTVDVGGCASLNSLTCDDNPNLTELTLYALTETEEHGLTRLAYLSCARNSLTKLDIFRCWWLEELDCSGNRLSSLELMSNTKKHSIGGQTVALTLAGNGKDGYSLPIALNNPIFSGENADDFSYENGVLKSTNPKAGTVEFSIVTNNREQSFPRLTGTLELSYQDYQADEAEILIDENHFPDPAFRAWILNPGNLGGAGKDGVLTQPEIAAVKSIDVSGLGIADLTGIRQFTALQTLNCSGNRLTALDLTGLAGLIACESGGQMIDLTLGANEPGTYLDRLALHNPVFSGEKSEAFTYRYGMLKSTDNTAAAINFSVDTGLAGKTLSGAMRLSYLEYIPIDEHRFPNARFRYWLRNSANLNSAGLDGILTPEEIASAASINFATSTILDITGIQYFSALQSLKCGVNDIEALDVSGLSRLQVLHCNDNWLTELPISGCTKLRELWCDGNELTALDLTGIQELESSWLDEQEPTLTLTGNEKNGYSLPIALNNPTFQGNNASAFTYQNGVLKSTNKAANTVDFSVETGYRKPLKGTLRLLYNDAPAYTLTVENGTGGGVYAPGTPAAIAAAPPEGYAFDKWEWTKGLGVLTDPTAASTTFIMGASNATVTALYKNIGVPTGEVKVGTNGWKQFLKTITFGLFFKDTQDVTITAAANSGDTVTIEYFLSSDVLTLEDVKARTEDWTVYTDKFTVNPDNKFIVYARLTNAAGNVTYICSNGIILDQTVPHIAGAWDGGVYDTARRVRVTDDYLESVVVNGTDQPVENGVCVFTLTQNGLNTITARDQAGNETAIRFTIQRAPAKDATLSNLYYHVNGGDPVEIMDYTSESDSHSVLLPRETPRDATITLSGVCAGENAAVTSTTPGHLVYGETKFDAPATLTVTAEDGTEKSYEVHFYTDSIVPVYGPDSILGVQDGDILPQNSRPSFTVSGVGMDNQNPAAGDWRYRPLRWRVDDGAILSGAWNGAPYTSGLDLSKLPLGEHELSVVLYEEMFTEIYNEDGGTGEYGWTNPYQYPESEERQIVTISFTVTEAAATYTLIFDTDGGAPIPLAQTLAAGTKPVAVTDPEKEGYTFLGWYNDDNEKINLAEFEMPETDVTLKAKWQENTYLLTVENGTGSGRYKAETPVSIQVGAVPKEGYAFDKWVLTSGDGTIADATAASTTFTMAASDATVTATYKDVTPPTGEVKVGTNGWKQFLNTITFGRFFKDTQDVTITAADNSGDTVTIEYFLSSDLLTLDEVKAKAEGWSSYTGKFSVDPDQEFIVYTRLTDKAGNMAYLSSDGVVLDATPPVISGADNGETYDKALNITVTDQYLETVIVNGGVRPVENGSSAFALMENGSYTIIAKDKAGNETTITITIDIPPETYVLSFDTDGGTPVPPAQTLAAGATPAAVTSPTKEGYTFLGWYNLDGEKIDLSTFVMPDTNVTLTAKWEKTDVPPETYTLTFETDGGTPVPPAQMLAAGAKPAVVTDPAKEGYTFLGWYNDDHEKVNLTEFEMPETSVTLKAKWEKNETSPTKYILTVENGTGDGQYKAGEQVSISATVPEGKEFVKWEVKSGNGTLRDAQSEQTAFTMGESDAVVAAVFKDSGITDPTNPSDPTTPTNPSQPAKPSDPSDNPHTGDDFPAWPFWTALLSLCGIGVTLLSSRKRKAKDK